MNYIDKSLRKLVSVKKPAPKIISLFSGCGGLDLPFHKSGYDLVWANDFDESSYENSSTFKISREGLRKDFKKKNSMKNNRRRKTDDQVSVLVKTPVMTVSSGSKRKSRMMLEELMRESKSDQSENNIRPKDSGSDLGSER